MLRHVGTGARWFLSARSGPRRLGRTAWAWSDRAGLDDARAHRLRKNRVCADWLRKITRGTVGRARARGQGRSGGRKRGVEGARVVG
jgi:hypothetical protein